MLVVLAAPSALASPVRAIGNVLIGSGRLPVYCTIWGAEVVVNLTLSINLALVMGPLGAAVGTLGGILLVRLPGCLVVGCRATGVRVSALFRQAIVPNILPGVGCAAVLLGLRRVPIQSVGWVHFEAAAGCVAHFVLFLLTATTPDERARVLAFVTRPLLARWRPDVAISPPVSIVDEMH